MTRLVNVGRGRALAEPRSGEGDDARVIVDKTPEQMKKPSCRTANELQHRLLAHILNELAGEERYPDDVLFTIVEEIAAKGNLSGCWSASLAAAMEKAKTMRAE